MERSPFEHHIFTNFVPSDEESAAIREHLNFLVQSLHRLEGQFESLELAPTAVRERYLSLQSHIHEHRALISPLRRVPHELLQSIFIHCLPPFEDTNSSLEGMPMVLCRICTKWRNIAIATPVLWSALRLSTYPDCLGEPPQELLQKQKAGVEQWTARSGTVPLQLSFVLPEVLLQRSRVPGSQSSHWYSEHEEGEGFYLRFNSKDLVRLLHLLLPTCSRWHSLEIQWAGHPCDLYPIFDTLDWNGRNPMRTVRKLRLQLNGGLVPNYTDEMSRVIGGFVGMTGGSSLEELSFWHDGRPGQISALMGHLRPTSSIRLLTLEDGRSGSKPLAYEDALQVLRSMVNVRKVSVAYLPCSTAQITPTPPPNDIEKRLINPHLTHLCLYFSSYDQVGEEFVTLTDWPALRSLVLRPLQVEPMIEGPAPTDQITRLVVKIGSSLTSLTISAASEVWMVLVHLPILVHLHLETRDFVEIENVRHRDMGYIALWRAMGKSTIEMLTPGRREDSGQGSSQAIPYDYACPRLRYLRWDGCTFFTDASLLRLIVNRALIADLGEPVPLKQVFVVFSRPKEIDIIPECSMLVEGGLNLRLVYPHNDDVGFLKVSSAREGWVSGIWDEDSDGWGWA